MYATTGIPNYDYLIGDDVVVPPEEEKYYCEKIVRVPGSYLTFEVTYPVPAVSDSPRQANGAITFGCFASQYQITDEVIGAWSRILAEVPGSSLILKNGALVSADTCRFVHGLFGRNQISAERVRLDGPSDHYRFLETYNGIDIAPDNDLHPDRIRSRRTVVERSISKISMTGVNRDALLDCPWSTEGF